MANLGRRVNLALTDEEKIDAVMPMKMDAPEYPCGLRISFCDPELEKMDIDEMPDVGDLIDLRIFAEVTSISSGPMGRRIELQITDILDFEDETTEAPGE
jgi:hypothetical protein